MLHFCIPALCGHVGSVPCKTVHFCEHTLWPVMLNESVHTPDVHSVDVSLTVVHVAPNAPGATGGASAAGGGLLPEHAATTRNDAATRSLRMANGITSPRARATTRNLSSPYR